MTVRKIPHLLHLLGSPASCLVSRAAEILTPASSRWVAERGVREGRGSRSRPGDAPRPRAQSPGSPPAEWLGAWSPGRRCLQAPADRLPWKKERPTMSSTSGRQLGNACVWMAARMSPALPETLDCLGREARSVLAGRRGLGHLLGASLKDCPNHSPNRQGTWLTS